MKVLAVMLFSIAGAAFLSRLATSVSTRKRKPLVLVIGNSVSR